MSVALVGIGTGWDVMVEDVDGRLPLGIGTVRGGRS